MSARVFVVSRVWTNTATSTNCGNVTIMTTTQATDAAAAPDYIERDTYTGRHWFTARPGARRVDTFTAGELVVIGSAGVIWTATELANGRLMFVRDRYVADADDRLHCYDSTGRKVIVHPAARALRILTR